MILNCNYTHFAVLVKCSKPGHSNTYVNPYDAADHVLSVGYWVYVKGGAAARRCALELVGAFM
jgi:hypothetical protein